jgi:hypothetical protein
MPTSAGPNTKGEENLVFGYDLGDVKNSYRGEPTVNLVPDGGLIGMSGVTLTYLGLEDGWKKYSMSGTFSSGTYPYIMRISDVAFQAGVVYTSKCRVKTNVEGKFNYFGTNGINYVNQPLVTGLSGVMSTVRNSDGSYTLARANFAYVSSSSQPGYLYTNPINNTAFSASTDFVWIRDLQIEQKNHATPYVAGTRSATQGLLDLTGRSTVDLSNVSFDSSAQMTFDGTDDFVNITNATQTLFDNSKSHSFSLWLKKAGNNSGNYAYVYDRYGTYRCPGLLFALNTNTLVVEWRRADDGDWIYNSSGLSVETGIWNFVTVTIEAPGAGLTKTIKVYLYKSTGLETATMTSTTDWNAGTSGSFVIGKSISNNTYFNGQVAGVSTYSRVLTASEVQSNYNAIKGRFNIG